MIAPRTLPVERQGDAVGQPIAIDLFCGLGGWTDGLLAEGYYVIGFDIEQHVYGEERYPAQLVLQDVLTLHGAQFKNVDLIVASPPCQEYSYMARVVGPDRGFRFDGSGGSFQTASVNEGLKGGSGSWFNDYKSRKEKPSALLSMTSSKSPARRAASAKIAKIPFALSSHIARVYRPIRQAA